MSNAIATAFRKMESLQEYLVMVSAHLNLNPFSWAWLPDVAAHDDDVAGGRDRGVGFQWLLLTTFVSLHRRARKKS